MILGYGIGHSMQELVSSLQMEGLVNSDRVAETMSSTDRAEFCPSSPYADMPMEIGYNATISAPHMHAISLEQALPHLHEGAKVLDIGSGSGYLSVCFAKLTGDTGKVVGIDHIDGIVDLALQNTSRSHGYLLDSGRLQYVLGDGRLGYPPLAPYDVIHVGAASSAIPDSLVEQLAANGLMIIPVGSVFQTVKLVAKDEDGKVHTKDAMDVRYVPLTSRQQQ